MSRHVSPCSTCRGPGWVPHEIMIHHIAITAPPSEEILSGWVLSSDRSIDNQSDDRMPGARYQQFSLDLTARRAMATHNLRSLFAAMRASRFRGANKRGFDSLLIGGPICKLSLPREKRKLHAFYESRYAAMPSTSNGSASCVT